jgi:hypothetical protein
VTRLGWNFMAGCRNAITAMRGAGLNNAQIACIIEDIRAAVLNEEFRRIRELIAANPPSFPRWVEIMDEIAEGK